MFPKIIILGKNDSQTSGRCRWICINVHEGYWEAGKYFFSFWCSRPINKKAVSLGSIVSICYGASKLKLSLGRISNCLVSLLSHLGEWYNNYRVDCHQHRWCTMEWPWMTVLRGVVYSVKSSGPSTEPWGKPKRSWASGERTFFSLIFFTPARQVYEGNQTSSSFAIGLMVYGVIDVVQSFRQVQQSESRDSALVHCSQNIIMDDEECCFSWIICLCKADYKGFDLFESAKCDTTLLDTTFPITFDT